MFLLVLIIGSLLFLRTPPEETAEAESVLEMHDKLYASETKANVLSEIEKCGKLYVSWGGKFNHTEMNDYLTYFENIGKLYQR